MSDVQPNLKPDQTVAGYQLRERIGVGGYGEVWSAEAPGGMLKAIKFIFGFLDENRAQRELKALDRIKHIRHPFLLSLERIEILEGRMVVITELAEMCLKNKFNQCVEQGTVGIERGELLQYIRESADALDYIAESFSLAHLDIKPENILLVSGHAKVADFGMVKDLQAVNQSLMEGLTPAYAAPELFDGRPGLKSDQYSLALVFQEMLTGHRPFSGNTAAQLANQHLHSPPDLGMLPRTDQLIVSRALAKQPEKRFPNCRAFVEELCKRKTRVRRKPNSQPIALDMVDTRHTTQANIDVQAIRPERQYESVVTKQKPLQLDESRAQVRPTLIIGVGKTGAQILCNYRQKISARLGSPEEVPAIRLLCLDADRQTLYESTMGNEYSSLQNYETMDIPLRSSDEYRKDTNLDLSWLGRRWLYNIPKNQLTGSLRPLGRLAFNFHHERIYRKISDELAKAALPENLAITSETTQLIPSELPPQVIFVGSVAGGLGSGLFLDLAFTTRVCMTEQGFSSDHLFGLFAHSTSRYVGDHRLSIANSVSFLNELYHFNLNGYPGNAPCDIPAFDDETPVFDGTYLVHLGDDISTEEFDRGVDGMAEYLYAGTATRCRAFFDVCRNTQEFEAGMLKTMGISSICQGLDELSEQSSERMIEELLTQWLDEDSFASRSCAADTMANAIIEDTVLCSESLEKAVFGLVQECLGDQPENLLLQKVIIGLQERPAAQFSQLAFTDKILDESLGTPAPDRNSNNSHELALNPNLCQFLAQRIPELASRTRLEITEMVTQLIDHSDFRISGARAVLRSLLNRLEATEVDLEYQSEKHWVNYEGAEQRLTGMLNDKDCPLLPEEATVSSVTEMVTDRIRHVLEAYKRKLVRLVRYELQYALDRVDEYRTGVEMLWNRAKSISTTRKRPVAAKADASSLYQLLQSHATDRALARVDELAAQLEISILQPQGGLRAIIDDGGNRMRMLPKLVKHEAQMMISADLRGLRLDSLIIDSGLPPQVLAASIQELVSPAKPLLYNCGGTARLLIAVPSNAPITTLTSYIEENMSFRATVIPSTCGDFSVCVEMDRMPSENVAMSLLNLQPDCAELVERLHCRTDVEWSNLTTVT